MMTIKNHDRTNSSRLGGSSPRSRRSSPDLRLRSSLSCLGALAALGTLGCGSYVEDNLGGIEVACWETEPEPQLGTQVCIAKKADGSEYGSAGWDEITAANREIACAMVENYAVEIGEFGDPPTGMLPGFTGNIYNDAARFAGETWILEDDSSNGIRDCDPGNPPDDWYQDHPRYTVFSLDPGISWSGSPNDPETEVWGVGIHPWDLPEWHPDHEEEPAADPPPPNAANAMRCLRQAAHDLPGNPDRLEVWDNNLQVPAVIDHWSTIDVCHSAMDPGSDTVPEWQTECFSQCLVDVDDAEFDNGQPTGLDVLGSCGYWQETFQQVYSPDCGQPAPPKPLDIHFDAVDPNNDLDLYLDGQVTFVSACGPGAPVPCEVEITSLHATAATLQTTMLDSVGQAHYIVIEDVVLALHEPLSGLQNAVGTIDFSTAELDVSIGNMFYDGVEIGPLNNRLFFGDGLDETITGVITMDPTGAQTVQLDIVDVATQAWL